MKYLFFDIEAANSKTKAICTFGYVLTDDRFNVFEKEDILVNPKSRYDRFVLEKLLHYSEKELENSPDFSKVYDKIKKLIEEKDQIIFGYSIVNDIKFLNSECVRYKLQSINYKFVDIQKIIGEYINEKEQIGIDKATEVLNIEEPKFIHKSDDDAYTTMNITKSICNKLDVSIEELIYLTNATGSNQDYRYNWDCFKKDDNVIKHSINNKKKNYKPLPEGKENYVSYKSSENFAIFLLFLDNVKPEEDKYNSVISSKRLCISKNYEESHFKEMINLIQIITNAGGTYILKSSESDLFITYERPDIKRECSRLKYVSEANLSGKNIEIINFDELMKILEITEEELNNMPMKDITYLENQEYSNKNKDVHYEVLPA